MGRVKQIDEMVASRTSDLRAAQAVLAEATQTFALNPGDKGASSRAKQAKVAIADITPEIESLQMSREQAALHDASDENVATLALRAEKADIAIAHLAALKASAEEVDTTFMGLMLALMKWHKKRGATHVARHQHTVLLPLSIDEQIDMFGNETMHLGSGSPNAAVSLACLLSDLVAGSGLDMNGMVAFNIYGYEGFNASTAKFGKGRLSFAQASLLIEQDVAMRIKDHERRYG